MAIVTIELRNCLKIEDFELFDFDYPIADLFWKEELESTIIDQYYFHEIGQETIDAFKQRFASRLRLIMPYYNELFKTKLLDFDPLLTQHLTETMNDSSNIISNANTVSGTTFTEYPEHPSMVDDIASNKSEGQSDNTQNTTTAHDYKKVISGYSGVNASQLLLDYRKTIININQMIIDDLKQCFILIY